MAILPNTTFPGYERGSDVDLLCDWVDSEGHAVDPDAISLLVTEPDGTQTTKAIGDLTQVVTGTWRYRFRSEQNGLHRFTFTATLTGIQTVRTGHFKVVEPNPVT